MWKCANLLDASYSLPRSKISRPEKQKKVPLVDIMLIKTQRKPVDFPTTE